MPIYEYRCTSCGAVFEKLFKSRPTETPVCPDCGAENPRKLLSTFSARVASSTPSCGTACEARGACSDGACATGQCPFSAN